MPARPLFIGSEIYRHSSYGGKHPLAIQRVSTVIDLLRALDWLPDGAYVDSPRATPAQLARFHDPDYVAAVQQAERDQALPPATGRRYGIGQGGNPIFREVFSRPATACGGSILAAELLTAGPLAAGGPGGPTIVHHPAGGTHHGRRDHAAGFCYFNDPVLAILRLLDRGLSRVFYLDIDAHHGDGVEAAFAGDPRVLTVSIHEAGRWPHTGAVDDPAIANAVNLAVPEGYNDSEMAFLLDAVVLPLMERFSPQAIVVQGGADALAEDPQSRLAVSNAAYFEAIARVMPLAPRLLVLGGGGYNPWAVARCWTGIWAVLNGIDIPDQLPPAAERVLRGLSWSHSLARNPPEAWFTTLADRPRSGPVRPEIRAFAERRSSPLLDISNRWIALA